MKQLGALIWNEFKIFENTCDRAHSKLSSWTAAYNVTKEETSYHAVSKHFTLFFGTTTSGSTSGVR